MEDVGAAAGATVGEAEIGAVLLHKLRSAAMLLNILWMTGFERRLRLEPSPLKLPLKRSAETLPIPIADCINDKDKNKSTFTLSSTNVYT